MCGFNIVDYHVREDEGRCMWVYHFDYHVREDEGRVCGFTFFHCRVRENEGRCLWFYHFDYHITEDEDRCVWFYHFDYLKMKIGVCGFTIISLEGMKLGVCGFTISTISLEGMKLGVCCFTISTISLEGMKLGVCGFNNWTTTFREGGWRGGDVVTFWQPSLEGVILRVHEVWTFPRLRSSNEDEVKAVLGFNSLTTSVRGGR